MKGRDWRRTLKNPAICLGLLGAAVAISLALSGVNDDNKQNDSPVPIFDPLKQRNAQILRCAG